MRSRVSVPGSRKLQEVIRIEVVIHDENADEEDIEDLVSGIRHRVKYANGMGSFTVSVVERDAD